MHQLLDIDLIVFLFNFSKQKLFANKLVSRWVITVVKWVKISGMLEGGSASLKPNMYTPFMIS